MGSVAQQKRRRDIYMFDGGPGRQYIGQTIDLDNRREHHRYSCARGRRIDLYNAVRDDPRGWDAFPLRVIVSGWWTDEQTNAAEIGYIAHHNTYHNGLNMTKGGDTTTGRKATQETRDRIGASNSGRKMPPRSPEYRAKMRAASLGRKHTAESNEKNRQAHLGKVASAETIAKQSAATIGKAKPPEHGSRVSATLRARGISFSKEAHEKARRLNTGRKVPAKDRYRMGGVRGAKFREENIGRVMEMRAAQRSMRVIADELGVAECTIARWIKREKGRGE